MSDPTGWGLMPYSAERQLQQYNPPGSSRQEGWTVILSSSEERRLVLYNAEQRQLAVQSTPAPAPATQPPACPLCHGPLPAGSQVHREGVEEGRGGWSGRVEGGTVMDPHYFVLLASTMEGQQRLRSHSLAYIPQESETTQKSARPQGLSSQSMIDGYYERFFVEERKIGSGLRGQVFLCRHVIEGEVLGQFAVKKIPVGDNHEWFVAMLTEVHMLEKLHHPNVLDYKHAWLEHAEVAIGPRVPCLFLLIEYANSGNLAQYLWDRPPLPPTEKPPANETKAAQRRREILQRQAKERGGTKDATNPEIDRHSARYLPEEELVHLMRDFMLGLEHLHRYGVIHRDLKPQNLLLNKTSDTQKYHTLLVSDFGECEVMASVGSRLRSGHTGTIEYMAPELLRQDDMGLYSENYDIKSDMWSAGVILYVMAFGQLPWQSKLADFADLRNEILAFKQPQIPEPLEGQTARSAPIVQLIRDLMHPVARKRPTTSRVLHVLQGLYPRTPPLSPGGWQRRATDTPDPASRAASPAPIPDPTVRVASNKTKARPEAAPQPIPGPVATPPTSPQGVRRRPVAGRQPVVVATGHRRVEGGRVALRLGSVYVAAVFAKVGVSSQVLGLGLSPSVLNAVLLLALVDLLLLMYRYPWRLRAVSGLVQGLLLIGCWPDGLPSQPWAHLGPALAHSGEAWMWLAWVVVVVGAPLVLERRGVL